MALQIDDKTEITVPLKTLISIVSVIVVASWYVFTTQNRIAELEHSLKLSDERFVAYTKQPGREQLQVALMGKDLAYLQQQVNELSKKVK